VQQQQQQQQQCLPSTGKGKQDTTYETEPETTNKCKRQTIKNRKRSRPTTENRPQQLEVNCNNRYEQLSQLSDADNDDIMLTDGTDNPQPTKKNRRERDPKPPPLFVYGVTNFSDMTAHLSAIIEEGQYHCKVVSNDTIKIYAATSDSYRILIKHLQEDKIIYHTYQMKQ
jgi:hypothetical protein